MIKITVKFITLGCKTNFYESEAMKKLFSEGGYTITQEAADIYIINTCTVTGSGAHKSRQAARRCKKENPDAIVAVTGCYAQISADEVEQIDGVDIVCGTDNRKNIIELVEKAVSGIKLNMVKDISALSEFEEMGINDMQSRIRAFVKIQDGCDNFCSYCIIPYARGRVRSRRPENILNEAKRLINNGFSEIVLTGIHIASYGKDIENLSLSGIIQSLNEIEGLKRLRLGSLEPNLITKEFVDKIKTIEKLCPQFHLSLQSGCDETLKRMNRKYTTLDYKNSVTILRNNINNVSITTDVLVGFPGETEDEFEKSYDFCKKIGFMQMHVFKYSKREGTPAAAMDNQVSNKIKDFRSEKMLELANVMKNNYYRKYIEKTVEVLFEQKTEDGRYHGLTANYTDVLAKCELDLSGKFKTVKIVGIEGEFLTSELV